MSTWAQHTADAWPMPQPRAGAFQANAFEPTAFLTPVDTTREWPSAAAGSWTPASGAEWPQHAAGEWDQ